MRGRRMKGPGFLVVTAIATAAAVGSASPVQARLSAPSTRELYVQPTLRARIGPSFPLGDSPPPAPSPTGGLSVGVELGGALGWPGSSLGERLFMPSLWLFPELGYAYRSDDSGGPALHLGTLGLGVGFGNLLLATVAYTPRLCVGASVGAAAGESAVGLRHGVSGNFFGMLLSIELAHQLLRFGNGVLANELQLTFGANLGSLFILLSPFR